MKFQICGIKSEIATQLPFVSATGSKRIRTKIHSLSGNCSIDYSNVYDVFRNDVQIFEESLLQVILGTVFHTKFCSLSLFCSVILVLRKQSSFSAYHFSHTSIFSPFISKTVLNVVPTCISLLIYIKYQQNMFKYSNSNFSSISVSLCYFIRHRLS